MDLRMPSQCKLENCLHTHSFCDVPVGIFSPSHMVPFVQKITYKFKRKTLTGDMTGNIENLCYLKKQILPGYQEAQ